MPNSLVLYSKKDHVGYVTLNHPENGNRIGLPMAQELTEICQQLNQDEEVYVVMLTGAGEAFCLGGDEKALINLEEKENLPPKFSPSEIIAGLDRPVLAALNGDTLGRGLELALACDIRIASDKAKLGLPQITEGYIPVDGGTQRLSRIAGKAKALEMVLTGEVIRATEALEVGLVNKVVSSENLASEAENLARTIATKAPIALRYAREAVNKGLDLTLDQGLRFEADLYFLLHTTTDRVEGIQSFLQKRQPRYKGK
jgi:enoyl-CoA hydratase/carnithine racemase